MYLNFGNGDRKLDIFKISVVEKSAIKTCIKIWIKVKKTFVKLQKNKRHFWGDQRKKELLPANIEVKYFS